MPILPAVHTTNVTSFSEIIERDSIKLTLCKYYKKDLLYFFYGKPSYKVTGRSNTATRILGDAAITFVFDISTLPKFYKSFALDTGASFGSRYDRLLPKGLSIDDFVMGSDPAELASYVTRFFGGNQNYFVGEHEMGDRPNALDSVSNAISDIAKSVSSIDLDERACTCEIQLDSPISFRKAKLITIVMPGQVFDEREVKDALIRWNVKPILYRMKRAVPTERSEVISEKLGDFYELEGYF